MTPSRDLSNQPADFVCQRLAELAMLVGVEMDAIFLAGDYDRPGVEERHMVPHCGQPIVVGELPGFFSCPSKHLIELGQGRDRWRRDEENLGLRSIGCLGESPRHLRKPGRAL